MAFAGDLEGGCIRHQGVAKTSGNEWTAHSVMTLSIWTINGPFVATPGRHAIFTASRSTQVHRQKGMTLKRAVVNLKHIFEAQMAYVALSRVRILNGLSVVCDMGLKTLQERGRLGGGSDAVKAFMEERFGPAVLNDASVA